MGHERVHVCVCVCVCVCVYACVWACVHHVRRREKQQGVGNVLFCSLYLPLSSRHTRAHTHRHTDTHTKSERHGFLQLCLQCIVPQVRLKRRQRIAALGVRHLPSLFPHTRTHTLLQQHSCSSSGRSHTHTHTLARKTHQASFSSLSSNPLLQPRHSSGCTRRTHTRTAHTHKCASSPTALKAAQRKDKNSSSSDCCTLVLLLAAE